MTTTTQSSSKSQMSAYESRAASLSKEAVEAFSQVSRFYAMFHLTFFLIAASEIFLFLLFFSVLSKSTLLAFTIAAFFLTAFSYFVLHYYHQTKKPSQFRQIISLFLDGCRAALPFPEGSPNLHLSVVNGIYLLLQDLGKKEYHFYRFQIVPDSVQPVIKKLSAWLHWKDVLNFKELLYEEAIQELFLLIKSHPTDIEAHASLASCYSSYAHLYTDPRKVYPDDEFSWIPKAYGTLEMEEQFEVFLKQALEEWKIVNEYSVGDPWVHLQLAEIYRELKLWENEKEHYVAILKLSPQNREVYFRLGVLYFKQGQAANGLKIYEHLKKQDDPKAEEMIQYYGSGEYRR